MFCRIKQTFEVKSPYSYGNIEKRCKVTQRQIGNVQASESFQVVLLDEQQKPAELMLELQQGSDS